MAGGADGAQRETTLISKTPDAEAASALAVLDEVQRQLSSITTVVDAKELADRAAAIEHYLKRASQGLKAQNYCAYVKLSAQRRVGELLEASERLKGRPRKHSHSERLSDLGIDANKSHRWRLLAKLSPDALDSERQQCDRINEELTAARMQRLLRTLYPEESRLADRPWEDWSDRPSERVLHDGINYLFRHAAHVLRAEGRAADALDAILDDNTGYLDDFDIERLRDTLQEAATRLSNSVQELERRLQGRPRRVFAEGPTLCQFVNGA